MSNRKPYGVTYQRAMMRHAKTFDLSKSTFAALRALLDYCNGATGQSRPGKDRIMDDANIRSRTTIDKALQELRDKGLVMPIAYASGGRGRATVYAFCLPAWSGTETPPNFGGESASAENENPPKNWTKPPQKLDKTPPKIGGPTKGTNINKGIKGAASRSDMSNGDVTQSREYVERLGHLSQKLSYGEARAIADREFATVGG